jgi:hypothetical protein
MRGDYDLYYKVKMRRLVRIGAQAPMESTTP